MSDIEPGIEIRHPDIILCFQYTGADQFDDLAVGIRSVLFTVAFHVIPDFFHVIRRLLNRC